MIFDEISSLIHFKCIILARLVDVSKVVMVKAVRFHDFEVKF